MKLNNAKSDTRPFRLGQPQNSRRQRQTTAALLLNIMFVFVLVFAEGGQEPTSVESMIGSAGMAKLRQQNGDMNPNSRYYYLGNSRHPTPNLDTFARPPSKAYFGANLDPPVDRDTIYDYGDQQPQFQLGYQGKDSNKEMYEDNCYEVIKQYCVQKIE